MLHSRAASAVRGLLRVCAERLPLSDNRSSGHGQRDNDPSQLHSRGAIPDAPRIPCAALPHPGSGWWYTHHDENKRLRSSAG